MLWLLLSTIIALVLGVTLRSESYVGADWPLAAENITFFDEFKHKGLVYEDLNKAQALFKRCIDSSESAIVHPKTSQLVLLDKFGHLYHSRATAAEVSQHEYKVSSSDVDGGSSNRGSCSAGSPGSSGLRWRAAGERCGLTPVKYVGPGRPLGFEYDGSGKDLYICDSLKGLLRYRESSGELSILANAVSEDSPIDPGAEIHFANDLTLGPDGDTVYFTTSTDNAVRLSGAGTGPSAVPFYDTFETYLRCLITGDATGRLLRFNVRSGQTHVLLNGLAFANGVALSADQSFVAVVETNRLRVLRYWISGPKAGSSDVLVKSLPGFPDGIAPASDGGFWLALGGPTDQKLRFLKYPSVRRILVKLPLWARPPIPSFGGVAKLSAQGAIERVLVDTRDPPHRIAGVSSVYEADGYLFMGHVKGDYVSVVDLAGGPWGSGRTRS